MRRQILRSKICGRAMLAPTFGIERSIIKRACCSSLCNRRLINLGLGWSTNRVGGGSAARPTRSEQKSPVSEETGDFNQICTFQYAERKLATSRAVLLDFLQAECIRLEMPAAARRKNPPFPKKRGILIKFVLSNTPSGY